MIEIFTVTHHTWSVEVALAWDHSKSETVGETDHISTSDAENMAIGRLWETYQDEILEQLRNLWTTGQFAKAGK